MDSDEIGGVEVPEPMKQKRMPEFEPVRQRRRRWPFFVLAGCLLLCCLCLVLPICLLITGVATAASVLENSKITASGFEQVTIDADEIVTLEVDNAVGDIRVERGSGDEIVVNYTKTARSFTKDMAREALKAIVLSVDEPSADRVVISVNQEEDQFFCGDRDGGFFCGSQSVDMTISVPEQVRLVISNNVGDIRVENVTARDLQITNNTGDVHVDADLGPSGDFSIETDVGDIMLVLPDDTFIDVNAETSVGDINLSDFNVSQRDEDRNGPSSSWQGTLGDGNETPPSLRLRTNVGDITFESR